MLIIFPNHIWIFRKEKRDHNRLKTLIQTGLKVVQLNHRDNAEFDMSSKKVGIIVEEHGKN